MNKVAWRRSSYSAQEGSDCVEVAPGKVRDSKNQTGPILTFTPTAFATFVSAAKSDRFER